MVFYGLFNVFLFLGFSCLRENFWTFFPQVSSCVESPLKTVRPFPDFRVEQAMLFLGGEVLRDIFFKLPRGSIQQLCSSNGFIFFFFVISTDHVGKLVAPTPTVRVACHIVLEGNRNVSPFHTLRYNYNVCNYPAPPHPNTTHRARGVLHCSSSPP